MRLSRQEIMSLKLLNTKILAARAQAALDPVFQDVHRNKYVLMYTTACWHFLHIEETGYTFLPGMPLYAWSCSLAI